MELSKAMQDRSVSEIEKSGVKSEVMSIEKEKEGLRSPTNHVSSPVFRALGVHAIFRSSQLNGTVFTMAKELP